MPYVQVFVILYQRESSGSTVFRLASKEDKDILDDPIPRSPCVSQEDTSCSDLFDGTGGLLDPVIPRPVNQAPSWVTDVEEARNSTNEQCALKRERNHTRKVIPHSTEPNWDCNARRAPKNDVYYGSCSHQRDKKVFWVFSPYTNIEPSSREGEALLRHHFICQSAPGIQCKLQKASDRATDTQGPITGYSVFYVQQLGHRGETKEKG